MQWKKQREEKIREKDKKKKEMLSVLKKTTIDKSVSEALKKHVSGHSIC